MCVRARACVRVCVCVGDIGGLQNASAQNCKLTEHLTTASLLKGLNLSIISAISDCACMKALAFSWVVLNCRALMSFISMSNKSPKLTRHGYSFLLGR